MSSLESPTDAYEQLLGAVDEAQRFGDRSKIMILNVGTPADLIQSPTYREGLARLPGWTGEELAQLEAGNITWEKYQAQILGTVPVRAAVTTGLIDDLPPGLSGALTAGFRQFNGMQGVSIRRVGTFNLNVNVRHHDVTIVETPSIVDPTRRRHHVLHERTWPLRNEDGDMVAVGATEATYLGPNHPETPGWVNLVRLALLASEERWHPNATRRS